MKKVNYTIVGMLLISGVTSLQSQTNSNYKIANKIKVEGDGGWDYLASDDATNRLFISHGTVVNVVNSSTADGADINQWSYAGNANQKWKIESVGSGFYHIVNVTK